MVSRHIFSLLKRPKEGPQVLSTESSFALLCWVMQASALAVFTLPKK